jgi:hypothetical protein
MRKISFIIAFAFLFLINSLNANSNEQFSSPNKLRIGSATFENLIMNSNEINYTNKIESFTKEIILYSSITELNAFLDEFEQFGKEMKQQELVTYINFLIANSLFKNQIYEKANLFYEYSLSRTVIESEINNLHIPNSQVAFAQFQYAYSLLEYDQVEKGVDQFEKSCKYACDLNTLLPVEFTASYINAFKMVNKQVELLEHHSFLYENTASSFSEDYGYVLWDFHNIAKNNYEFELAIFYGSEALKIFTLHDNYFMLSKIYQQIGDSRLGQANYYEALQSYKQGLSYAKQLKNHYIISVLATRLVAIYTYFESYDSALELCEKLEYYIPETSKSYKTILLNETIIYLMLDDVEKASSILNELDLNIADDYHEFIFLYYYLKSGITKNPMQARKELEKAISYINDDTISRLMADAYLLQTTLTESTNKSKAMQYALKANKISINYNFYDLTYESSSWLRSYFYDIQDYEQAAKYYQMQLLNESKSITFSRDKDINSLILQQGLDEIESEFTENQNRLVTSFNQTIIDNRKTIFFYTILFLLVLAFFVVLSKLLAIKS